MDINYRLLACKKAHNSWKFIYIYKSKNTKYFY